MAWRDAFLRWFGPGMLGGITFGDWVRLLRDNRFDVSPRRLVAELMPLESLAAGAVAAPHSGQRPGVARRS